MTRSLVDNRRYTVEEYFQIDSASEIRHEYVDGMIFDMAGGTDRHSHVITNVIGSTWSRLRGKPWQGRDSQLRVRYGRRAEYGYPDAMIVCGPPQFDSEGPRETTLLNPRVLIEVLSDSTEAYDRGRKFERYREIDSFVEYLLIDTDRPSVDVCRRQSTGLWTLQTYGGLDTTVPIESVEIDLPLVDIYVGITFPPEVEALAPTSPDNS